MATIRESLVLEDRFSAVFSSYLNLGKQIASNMRVATETQEGFTAAASESGTALAEMVDAGERAARSVEEGAAAAEKMANSSGRAADGQKKMNHAMRDGVSAASGLVSKLTALAAAYLSVQSAQKLIGLSDTWTQTTARLDRISVGDPNKQENLDVSGIQDMIFNAAQRSRGDYQDTADMVAKLGTLAPDAFGSTQEVVAFAEQINKQFALAGTSAQGAQAAMLQLTQAMSSGVLRGEELNSVLEQAPTITRAISQYMGVTIGEMRELASEGKITADIVKAAIFDAAKETNSAFEAVPMTFSQAMTMVKNEGLNALRPVLEELNTFLNSDIGRDALNGFISVVRMGGESLSWLVQKVEHGAQLIRDNWNTVSTVLQFAGGAILALTALSVASSIKRAAVWAIEHWQITLFIALMGAAVVAMYSMGMSSEEVFSLIGAGAGWLYALVYNLIADAWNVIAIFAEFIAGVFENPLAATARLFIDTFSAILGIIETAAGALDALTGWETSKAVSGFKNSLDAWADRALPKKHTVTRLEKVSYEDTMAQWSAVGAGLGKAVDNFNMQDFMSGMGGVGFDYDALMAASGINSTLADIGADTKAIKNSVALSEEDIKLLVDMATHEYVNNINLTSQTPIINITGQNTGDTELDKRSLANAIKEILIEEAASSTNLAYT